MNNLDERLAALRPVVATPSDRVISADLARGRAAKRARRRNRSAIAVGAFSLGLVGGGASLTMLSDTQPPGPAVALPATIELVTYTGPQPEGFSVSVVPEGFEVQDTNEHVLAFAPPGTDSDFTVFDDKVVVMLESPLAPAGDMGGEPVTVNGHPGAIRHTTGSTILQYDDGAHEIVIQSDDSAGLTRGQLLQLAAGIEVTADAQPTDNGGTTRHQVEKGTVDNKPGWRISPQPSGVGPFTPDNG